MVKRLFWREVALVTAPLLVIGGIFGWNAWQKRLRTPRIALAAHINTPTAIDQSPYAAAPEVHLSFLWDADIKGGPQSGYRFGWNESVVAKTPRGDVLVWRPDSQLKELGLLHGTPGSYGSTPVSIFFSSDQSTNYWHQSRDYTIETSWLPIDTQSLEWRGEVSVIPADTNMWQSPQSHQTLQKWGQVPGATSWHRTVTLPYDQLKQGAVVLRSQHDQSSDKFKIEVVSRQDNHRSFRRLVAFDGTTHRTLWTDTNGINQVCEELGNTFYTRHNGQTLRFNLKKVPASWGEVSFLYDTVFDVNGRALGANPNDSQLSSTALDAFQAQTNGFRIKRSLLLRPMPERTLERISAKL